MPETFRGEWTVVERDKTRRVKAFGGRGEERERERETKTIWKAKRDNVWRG